MQLNYLAFAIPGFFLFLLLEYMAAKIKNRTDIFKYESSVTNLSIGIAERLLNLFISAAFYSLFAFIYSKYALLAIPNYWWVWSLLILSTDLVWYWYHRLGHEINLFWAAHIVHHQSEEMNYTVAARITTFQALIRNLFWCILPFIGFHPDMVITMLLIHGAYSFFTHTQMIGKLGWLEYILITPSLHRVHHASNEKYLDKNYGDVFVFWDKIFGTFQKEEEEPVYGLTHPVKSYSFLWQHFHYFLEIAEAFRSSRGLNRKLRALFGSPANMDQNIRPLLEKRFLSHRSKDTRLRYKNYVTFQLILCIIVLLFIILFFHYTLLPERLASLSFILISLINCGALLEQRKWVYYLEVSRVFIVMAYISYAFNMISLLIVPLSVLLLLEALLPIDKWYYKCIYSTKPDSGVES